MLPAKGQLSSPTDSKLGLGGAWLIYLNKTHTCSGRQTGFSLSFPSQVLIYLNVEKVCLLSAEARLAAVLISTVWKATCGWT